MSEWTSVKNIKTLPSLGEKVLITNGEYEWVGFLQHCKNDDKDVIIGWVLNPSHYYCPFLSNKEPTHWMPLPEAPKEIQPPQSR